MKFSAKIKRDGTIEFLGGPPPGWSLPIKRSRFSEIIPVNPWLRRMFRVLRFVFGEEGRIASWTRRWRCGWECIILQGPDRGRCARQFGQEGREALVTWERNIWRR